MTPSASITNRARSVVPSFARYTWYVRATSPLGSKSASRGKCRFRSLAKARWLQIPSTEMPRSSAPDFWNSGRTFWSGVEGSSKSGATVPGGSGVAWWTTLVLVIRSGCQTIHWRTGGPPARSSPPVPLPGPRRGLRCPRRPGQAVAVPRILADPVGEVRPARRLTARLRKDLSGPRHGLRRHSPGPGEPPVVEPVPEVGPEARRRHLDLWQHPLGDPHHRRPAQGRGQLLRGLHDAGDVPFPPDEQHRNAGSAKEGKPPQDLDHRLPAGLPDL